MEENNYLNVLKSQKKEMDKIKVAEPRSANILKKQNQKCARCKKDLRSSYFKKVDNQIVCSECL